MADDLDYLDSLLDAPFAKTTTTKAASNDDVIESNGKQSTPDRDSVERKKRSRSRDKNRENGSSHKTSRKSRSRSKSRSKSREKRHKESKKDRKRSKSREKDRHREDKVKSRDKDRDKKRDRSRSRDKRRRSRSKSRDKKRDRDHHDEKRRDRKRSRSGDRRRRSYSPRPFRRGRTPPNGLGYRDDSPREDLAPEERDARTIFCMQLSQRTRARDLEEFFSSVGRVRDVRLITCNKTKRFKGIAYIEFKEPESVALALGLSGQRLLGIPIVVQHTQAEKNRLATAASPKSPPKVVQGPMRLYVGSLHFNITEEMLRGIFEPFGKVDNIQLITDPESGRSKGYGFITFHESDCAKKALEHLNGFEIAGRPMKVGNVTERLDVGGHTSLDNEDVDRTGIDLGATGRLQLMFKLAENAGLAVPQAAANALLAAAPQPAPTAQIPIEDLQQNAQQSFLLTNMFDPATETTDDWDKEIQDDVIEECNKHGGVLHIFVDTSSSEGKVYVKCPSIATAVMAVNSLRGRWFAGRVVTADYVPLATYHSHFPDATLATNLLQTSRTDD